MRIFVSHASQDVAIVQEFVALLKEIGVPNHHIFCSSLGGHGIPSGSEFKLYIREQFKESDVVVALLSQNYYMSGFCMCELGAVWITANQRFFPFLMGTLEFKDLKAVLVGTQGSRLDKATDLSELRDYIHQRLQGAGCNTPMWDESRERFLTKLSAITPTVPASTTVPRSEYEKIAKELTEYKAEAKSQKAKVDQLSKELGEVSRLKNREEVLKVSQQYKTENEGFKARLSEAGDNIKAFPMIIREALFHRVRREDFSPWESSGDEARVEIQRGRLREAGEDGNLVDVDTSDPDIGDALDGFGKLSDFVETASRELRQQYLSDYGEKLDVYLRPFWHRWFKLLG